jgi:hypothetical protein
MSAIDWVSTERERITQVLAIAPIRKATENEYNADNSIRAELKAYFHSHMDMNKAIAESNIYAGAPEYCDLCSGSFINDGFLVDGALKGQAGWACMCINCFGKYGKGLDWGVGQLYQNQGKLAWLQVAGFNK